MARRAGVVHTQLEHDTKQGARLIAEADCNLQDLCTKVLQPSKIVPPNIQTHEPIGEG